MHFSECFDTFDKMTNGSFDFHQKLNMRFFIRATFYQSLKKFKTCVFNTECV